MRLLDLHPRWIGTGGEGVTDRNGSPVPWRDGIGIVFDCPCGCGVEGFVPFTNPLSGGAPIEGNTWQRTGETFETLTLTPSILRTKPPGCGWHGFIINGEVVHA